jgi:hypothetical protein
MVSPLNGRALPQTLSLAPVPGGVSEDEVNTDMIYVDEQVS